MSSSEDVNSNTFMDFAAYLTIAGMAIITISLVLMGIFQAYQAWK